MKPPKSPPTIYEMVRFVIGVMLFVGLIFIHAFVKELPVFLLGSPFLLMGIDLAKLAQVFWRK